MAIPKLNPQDIENMQKVMETLGKFAPFLQAIFENMPPLRVEHILLPEADDKGNPILKDGKPVKKSYIALLIEPKAEEKPPEKKEGN